MHIETRPAGDLGGVAEYTGSDGIDTPGFCPPDLRKLASPPDSRIARSLHFILQRAFVDCRNLAYAKNHTQIAELADAMEFLPQFLDHWVDGDLEAILSVLHGYESRFLCRGYSQYLTGTPLPEWLV
jgi:hypothetical protein